MTLVIRITGKAKDVFATIKLMAEKAGKLTLGEIVRLGKK